MTAHNIDLIAAERRATDWLIDAGSIVWAAGALVRLVCGTVRDLIRALR